MSIHLDSKAMTVDALKEDHENFGLSMTKFPKKSSVKAVHLRYRVEQMLLKAAINPNVMPNENLSMPQPPDVQGLSEEEAAEAQKLYEDLKKVWKMTKEAHDLKVEFSDYIHIRKFLEPFDHTIHALSAVKGWRFTALTKNVEAQKAGGLSALLGGGDDK